MDIRKKIPTEKWEEYTLVKDQLEGYARSGWKAGTHLMRVSKWLPGCGPGCRQAYFVKPDRPYGHYIVWEDEVKVVTGQLELFS